MGPGPATPLIQVTNIAPTVNNEQLRTLFAFVGVIREFVVYPTNDPSQQMTRVCYVKYLDPMSVLVAQHLTNAVFIDRAIFVKPVADGKIPDEILALKLANEMQQNSSNSGVFSQIANINGFQSIATIDPRLNALGLPQYPPLPASLDPSKIEEIRRTVTISNISQFTTPEEILQFFTQFGEIKYLRMTSNDGDIIKSAMIEFTDQSSVANALQNTGVTLNGLQLIINHSSTSILKPQINFNLLGEKIRKSNHDLKGRFRDSVSPGRRSQSSSRRSRSPHRVRRRSISRSRSHERRRRSRSRDYRRSIERHKSRSPSYPKDRTRDRDRRGKSRDRERERDRGRDRDRGGDRNRIRSRERSVDRDHSRERRKSGDRERRREHSVERDHRSKEKERNRKRYRARSRESDRSKEKQRTKRDKDRDRRRSRSISKLKSVDDKKRTPLESPKGKYLKVDSEDKKTNDDDDSDKSQPSSPQKSPSPLKSASPSGSETKKMKLLTNYDSDE